MFPHSAAAFTCDLSPHLVHTAGAPFLVSLSLLSDPSAHCLGKSQQVPLGCRTEQAAAVMPSLRMLMMSHVAKKQEPGGRVHMVAAVCTPLRPGLRQLCPCGVEPRVGT